MSTTTLALSTGTTILVLVAALLALALVMTSVAVWLVRSTRGDAPALAPLEVMADRAWRRATPDQRVEILTDARPDGALTPAPMLPDEPDEPDAPASEPEPVADSVVADSVVGDDIEGDDIDVEVLHRYQPADG